MTRQRISGLESYRGGKQKRCDRLGGKCEKLEWWERPRASKRDCFDDVRDLMCRVGRAARRAGEGSTSNDRGCRWASNFPLSTRKICRPTDRETLCTSAIIIEEAIDGTTRECRFLDGSVQINRCRVLRNVRKSSFPSFREEGQVESSSGYRYYYIHAVLD